MPQSDNPLHFIVNKFCNNNCIFCMEDNARNLYVPTLKEAYSIFKDTRARTENILFTGPEPTVNKSLAEYVRLSRRLGYKRIRLVTNGRALCYLPYARELLKSGVNEFNVSLHGSKKIVHDALTRTPGSFEQTVKGCQNLAILRSHYQFQWYINFTLTDINAPDLYDFIKLASSFKGIGSIIINATIPRGRGKTFFKNIVFSYTDLVGHFKRAMDRTEKSASNRHLKRLSICLLGVPVCLMVGYENYANVNEPIFIKKGSKVVRFKGGTTYRKVKSKQCRRCKYFTQCLGVPWQYIKRKGWQEFQSVL